ncbi:hypothetical protein SXCC_01701 [Gluconacetobacter sp. SXCC-1]|nr:hypothetical protein SXCC_01701 [Gluconacetobacter sp. SXCC-1]
MFLHDAPHRYHWPVRGATHDIFMHRRSPQRPCPPDRGKYNRWKGAAACNQPESVSSSPGHSVFRCSITKRGNIV